MAETTIQSIKDSILAEKANYEDLNGLTSTSKVAIYNLWAYVIATVAWVQYQLWDKYKIELNDQIAAQKRYTLQDFRNMALAFRYGHELNDETGTYDEGVYTDEEIAVALIVKRAAVIELELNNRKHLFIKVATEDANGDLAKLTDVQIAALEQYFARIKPAGTKIIIFSDNADDLRMTLDFYYDPLILDETGVRIDGRGNTTVQDAIRAYLKDLKFNGEFTIAELENRLQIIEGCADQEAYVRSCEANYVTPEAWQQITASFVANSGYMKIDEINLNINFIAKTVAL